MTRVWLTDWEWECCGDPFEVGDEVALTVGDVWRGPLDALLGEELAATVGAEESHHDQVAEGRMLAGRVSAIHGVIVELRHTRMPRTGREPMRSTLTLRMDDGSVVVPPPSPYWVQTETVPRTAGLTPLRRVPSPRPESERDGGRTQAALRGEGPRVWTTRALRGWLVDVDPIDVRSIPAPR